MHIAQQCINWNQLLEMVSARLKTLDKKGELPDWAGSPDNVVAMMLVAILQRFTVQLIMMRDIDPECITMAKDLYQSYGLSDELSMLFADFIVANDSVKEAITERLRLDLGNLPWEVN
jgi:hypothetical protein